MRYCFGILFVVMVSLPYVFMVKSGGDRSEARQANPEVLTVISPHRREVRQEYGRGFAEWMRASHGRNVRIQWLDVGGTSKILKDLESRYAKTPDAVGVDVFFGGGVDPYYTALEHGWLVRVDPPEEALSSIPASCAGVPVYDPEHRWFGVALSGFGIVYHRQLVRRLNLPAPQTWEDLGRPEYFTWVASGDPRSSGSVHMCYEIILQALGFEEGWGLIVRMCANVRRFGEGGGTAPSEVAAGDVAAGMAIDQYAQTVIDTVGRENLAFTLPPGATMIGADGIGLLKGAAAPDLGRLFIEYVLSDAGQRLLFQPAGMNGQQYSLHRMPVRKPLFDDPLAPAVRPYEYPGKFEYDAEKGSRRRKMVDDLIGVCLIDAHRDLAAAWKEVIRSGMRPERVRRLCAPPVKESELDALSREWKDPRKRLAVMTAWAEEATRRYRELAP
jgi:ABC-type Fe3+ transport system substrate-binding protein